MLRSSSEFAHWMALLPLACLVLLARRGETRDAAWWWLAGAFSVSWLADTWADVIPKSQRWIPSLVYPLAQSALVGAVLLRRSLALWFLAALTAAGLSSAMIFGVSGPEILLRGMAWLGLGALVNRVTIPLRLRLALSVYFGLDLIVWGVFMHWPTIVAWYVYQGIRLAGLMLFCDAATHPTELRVIRGHVTRSHLRAGLA
jgi:hypothetical protein